MKGIQETPHGFRAYVRVKGFPLRTKRFSRETPLDEIVSWRERTRATLVLEREKKTTKPRLPLIDGTFRADAMRYLASVTALETYRQRCQHILEWVSLFRDRPTESITSAEIRAQRDRWLTVGPKRVQVKKPGQARIWGLVDQPLAASSVNHRLRALENMWTVLWPGQPNPVREVPEAIETSEHEPPTIHTPATLAKIFKQLRPSATKARLEVLRWTGISSKTLMRIKAEHVDYKRSCVWVPGRQKGKGTQGKIKPLFPEALAAFRALARWNAFGAFSTSSMWKTWQRACRRANVKNSTVYDLRHTWGTAFLSATKDLRATQDALDHSTHRLTERYVRAALTPAAAHAHRIAAAEMSPAARRTATTKRSATRKRRRRRASNRR